MASKKKQSGRSAKKTARTIDERQESGRKYLKKLVRKINAGPVPLNSKGKCPPGKFIRKDKKCHPRKPKGERALSKCKSARSLKACRRDVYFSTHPDAMSGQLKAGKLSKQDLIEVWKEKQTHSGMPGTGRIVSSRKHHKAKEAYNETDDDGYFVHPLKLWNLAGKAASTYGDGGNSSGFQTHHPDDEYHPEYDDQDPPAPSDSGSFESGELSESDSD